MKKLRGDASKHWQIKKVLVIVCITVISLIIALVSYQSKTESSKNDSIDSNRSTSEPIQSIKKEKRTLFVGAPDNIPPYFMDDGHGIHLDIIRSSLKQKGYILQVLAMSNMGIALSLSNGEIDIAPFLVKEVKDVFYSDDCITYKNIAISKKKLSLSIENIEDLRNFRIVSFQGALNVLGSRFRELVESGEIKLMQIANQQNQMKLFWADRADIIVVDKNIFEFYVDSHKEYRLSDISYHEIFPQVTTYQAVFRDTAIRDDFNSGLQEIRLNGDYDKIYERYFPKRK